MPGPENSEPPMRHVRRIPDTNQWEVVPEPSLEEQLQRWLTLEAKGVKYAATEAIKIQELIDARNQQQAQN